MAMHKIYTGFVSSVFTGMEAFREAAIESLLDMDIHPFCMEHFTVSGGEDRDLKKMIDASDVFILLLGNQYGSVPNGRTTSWTEAEYNYAEKQGKPILVLICTQELSDLLSASDQGKQISNSQCEQCGVEFKQFQFAQSLKHFRNPCTDLNDIQKHIFKHFHNRIADCPGWIRPDLELQGDALVHWQEANRKFNLDGSWYHVHLNEKDKKYIRIGEIEIRQKFSPDYYCLMSVSAFNYNAVGINDDGSILADTKRTEFHADYTLVSNRELQGIYSATRSFSGKFNRKKVIETTTYGVHILTLPLGSNNMPIDRMVGTFRDAAPARKHGQLYLFRRKEDRDAFLLHERKKYIGKK